MKPWAVIGGEQCGSRGGKSGTVETHHRNFLTAVLDHFRHLREIFVTVANRPRLGRAVRRDERFSDFSDSTVAGINSERGKDLTQASRENQIKAHVGSKE